MLKKPKKPAKPGKPTKPPKGKSQIVTPKGTSNVEDD